MAHGLGHAPSSGPAARIDIVDVAVHLLGVFGGVAQTRV